MALQVWLPLNGDLKNKGCADVTVTNNDATVNDDGKIGKCYDVTKTQYLEINNIPFSSLTNCSVSLWIKVSEIGSSGWLPFAGSSKSYYILATSKGTGNFYHSINNVGSNTKVYKDGIQTLVPGSIGEWHHYCVTGLNLSTWTKFYINHYEYSFWNFAGSINDIRIYDHCLSPKEVKEISQGLIVHYPLNHLFTKNLIDFDLTSNNYTIKNYANRTPGTIINGVYHVDGYQSETSADTSFGILSKNYITLKADTDYYLSFYCKSKSADNLSFSTIRQAYTGLLDDSTNYFRPTQSVTIGTEYAGYVVLKIHTGTSTQYKINLGFDTPNIWGIGSFIEFSKIVLSEVEPDLNACVENVVTDCSGYGNNGTITGNLTLSDDASRYNSSTVFDSGKIVLKNLNLKANEFTISFWLKHNSAKTYQPVFWLGNGKTANGISLHGNYSNRLEGGNGTIRFNTYGASLHLNNWYFMVVTYDGSIIKHYVNNALFQTVDYEAGFDDILVDLNIGYFWGGYYSGNISDFRLYVTALSAEDIKQLYEVSASIDDIGNVHSYEIDELSDGRELMILPLTTPYSNRTNLYKFDPTDGIPFSGSSSSCGTDYIEINPSGKKYIYDFTISVAAGNQFDIGFERYDKDKTARTNQACIYPFAQKPAADIIRKRYKGTVNLSTDGVNPCKYIRLRVLNAWSGTASDSAKTATIHQISLREVSDSTTAKTKLHKTGIFETDLLREGNDKAIIEKDVDMNINEFIEI